jgi:hypothetical protein
LTRLTFHIGIHRTGTTGLQRNLVNNRDRLYTKGIAYPFRTNNHQEIAWGLHRGELTGWDVRDRLEPFNDYGHIILSGEDFCIHKSVDWLDALKETYDIDAVVYLRRQDHWLMSWYNQHIKWPFSRRHSTMTPQQFLGCLDEFYWLDFDQTVSRWEAALGTDKVAVRVVEKGQVGDVVTDFLELMNIPLSDIVLDKATHNDSLPTEALEFARQVGLIDMKAGKRLQAVNFMREVCKSSTHTGKTLYTAEERNGLLERFAAGDRALAARRFGRDQIFLEGPPDDRDLYVEGTFAAHGSYTELMVKALSFIGRDHKS